MQRPAKRQTVLANAHHWDYVMEMHNARLACCLSLLRSMMNPPKTGTKAVNYRAAATCYGIDHPKMWEEVINPPGNPQEEEKKQQFFCVTTPIPRKDMESPFITMKDSCTVRHFFMFHQDNSIKLCWDHFTEAYARWALEPYAMKALQALHYAELLTVLLVMKRVPILHQVKWIIFQYL